MLTAVKKKAAKKKVAVKPVMKKVVPKPIPKYETDVDLDEDSLNIKVRLVKGNEDDDDSGWGDDEEAEFSMTCDATPYCCGLSELGSFTLVECDEVPREELVKAVRKGFHDFMARKTEGKQCETVLFTLVDSDDCDFVREVLEGTTLFTLVKTFRNKNSRNVNDLYVSNN